MSIPATASVALSLAALIASGQPVHAQETVIRGGWLFDSVRDHRVRNTGIVVRAGKFLEVGAKLEGRDLSEARVVELEDEATILPGLFDLHAHHGMNLFGRGRVDEAEYNPRIYLANGVTTAFPAGEMNPDRMLQAQRRIDAGELPGPRIMRSGPYFGSARPGWNRRASEADIRREVNELAGGGVRGFKAKGIQADHLRWLIDQAHKHGLTVTGHLGSGSRNSVNPADAIAMGIDRVEHFLGGDGLAADRSAYASLEDLDPSTDAFARITRLYIERGVYFDATLSAYGYFAERDPEVYTTWVDEKKFLTPFTREHVEDADRRVIPQFEKIYWVKRKTIKAFYDAGGGHLITLGTDHPSWGEFLAGFGVHRELHCLALAGIPPAAVIKVGTINGARALGVGDRLGTIEPGKLADLVVVEGNPLEDIRRTRHLRLVMKSGEIFAPEELLRSAVGKIGPSKPDEMSRWVTRWRRR